jgi:cytoskeletal protein CcmA (bactofilin family)
VPSDGTSEGRRSSMVLGPKDRLKGNLFVEGNLVVVGTVDGELEATGDVEIDRGGRVNGPVTARNRLVVGPSGSLLGDVRVARLVVEDGATFSGNVSMIKPGEAAKASPAAAKEPSVAATEVAPAPIKAPAA